jgi:hypothetical protein
VLQRFEDWVKRHLLTDFLAHVDETSINISGESLFLRKLVLGIPAQASGKNLTRPPDF